MNYEIEEGFEEAGKIYEPHVHEATHLITTKGSIELTIGEEEAKIYKAGDHVLVPANTQHHAVVGPDGWGFIAVWDADEAAKYPEVDH